ncbi:MAG: hypothetical protein ACU83N_03725 [Gammaproteobacteria bacterium]
MNIKLIKLLVAICGVLAVVIGAEWQYARYAKRHLLAMRAAEPGLDYASGELPQIELALHPEESYAELTNRPLFIEGRRPVPETEDESEQAVVPIEEFEWQLDGVYLHQAVSMALFSRSRKSGRQEGHLKKSEGEIIEGWTVMEVKADRVVLEQDGKQHVLMLRKPKPTQLPSQTPKSVPKAAAPAGAQTPFLKKSAK